MEYARPRFSRTSWNSLELTPPPRIAFRTYAPYRSLSPWDRPFMPKHTWACSRGFGRTWTPCAIVGGIRRLEAGPRPHGPPNADANCLSTGPKEKLPATETTTWEGR